MPVISRMEARHSLRKSRAIKSGKLQGYRPRPNETVLASIQVATPNEDVKEVTITSSITGEKDIFMSLAFLSGKDPSFDETLEDILYAIYLVTQRHALYYIRSGMYMYPNTGLYARQKAGLEVDKRGNKILPFRQFTGTRYTQFQDQGASTHPLGLLSGDLYNGVKNQIPGRTLPFAELHSFTMRTVFTNPPYIGYVHDGKPGKTEARPFLQYSKELAEQEVSIYIERKLRVAKLDNYKSVIEAFLIDVNSGAFGKEADDIGFISDFRNKKVPQAKRSLYRMAEGMTWWSSDYWG